MFIFALLCQSWLLLGRFRALTFKTVDDTYPVCVLAEVCVSVHAYEFVSVCVCVRKCVSECMCAYIHVCTP